MQAILVFKTSFFKTCESRIKANLTSYLLNLTLQQEVQKLYFLVKLQETMQWIILNTSFIFIKKNSKRISKLGMKCNWKRL